ncbi:hypothetical protein PHLCEN_2v6569 [Hermanssonia centrifuga]|uniref:Uncharacterized protein n=1 Tax=Hermanssonia centrifuga TaxID=98765 RepID=A0A2R6NZT4_9APHY|nr:hypothetical protein PHLCEN_2v6569 [Hermanssonia centrifuga]
MVAQRTIPLTAVVSSGKNNGEGSSSLNLACQQRASRRRTGPVSAPWVGEEATLSQK